jgi:hypothetical protein
MPSKKGSAHLSRCNSGWFCHTAINAPVHATKSCRNLSQRMHPIHPIGPQTHILQHFGPFCYCMNFGAKRAELLQLMHKFVPHSHVRIFHNERTRSTPLDPELMFCGISDHFVTTRTSVQNRLNATRNLSFLRR